MQASNSKRIWLPGMLALAVCCAPAAFAATSSDQGDTSGPATGTTAKPNAAIQKSANGSTGTGGSGVTGKSDTESGSAPSGSGGQPNKQQ